MEGKWPVTTNFDQSLRALPPRLACLAFFLSQGLGDHDIAVRTGSSYNAVKRLVWRIRNRLGFDGTRINLALAIREAIK